MNNIYNFEWTLHQSMTDGISSTVLMEPMDCVAMVDQVPGREYLSRC